MGGDMVKGGKRRKTRFEEYLEESSNDIVLGGGYEYDLKKEKELEKKLKVKNGKLGGVDDMLNDLLGGFLEGEHLFVEEDGVKRKKTKKKKKRKEEEEEEQEVEVDSEAVEKEPVVEPLPKKCKRNMKKNKQKKVCELDEESNGTDMGEEASAPQEPVADISMKYLPPHMRKTTESESEGYAPMRKRVKALLSQMFPSTVESITGEIFTIFQAVPRGIASQIIVEEVLTSFRINPGAAEQYPALFAAFVVGMTCLAGINFGAELLAALAKAFEDEYQEKGHIIMRNLTLLMCYLYIFGVCSSDLMFDLLLLLSKQLRKKDISTIHTILQCCGMKLRSEDPARMKEFILSVQNRVSELDSSTGDDTTNVDNEGMELMLKTMREIKNNKINEKKDSVQLTQIRKWLQKIHSEGILLRGLKWSKLLDPNKKGQWWLPAADVVSSINHVEEVAFKIDKEILETQKLLQLASAQGMNTDARKAIFCIIMSGDDYLDAFEKLIRLDVAGKQDREVVRVLVKCCLQEKVFNKYYTALASKLCSHNKNHKFSLQYCLWDHYKSLETLELQRSMHLAQFTAEMVSSFSLSLSILKVVDFSNVIQKPKMVMHFRMLFDFLLEYPEKTVWNIFTRIAGDEHLEILRTSILLFLEEHVVSRNKGLTSKFKTAKKALSNLLGIF